MSLKPNPNVGPIKYSGKYPLIQMSGRYKRYDDDCDCGKYAKR